jgi:hypothetical protein
MSNISDIIPLKPSEVAELAVFSVLWNRMPHKSFISGLWLRCYEHTPLQWNCLCHILPVKEYKYFQYYFGNIILMSPGERGLWMDGSDEDRIQYALDVEEKSRGKATARWDAVRELEIELRTLYKKNFPITYRGIVGYPYSLSEIQRVIGKMNKQFWDDFNK